MIKLRKGQKMALEEVLFFQNNIPVEELEWRTFDKNFQLTKRSQQILSDLKENLPFWSTYLTSYQKFSTYLQGKLTTKRKTTDYGQLFYLDEGNGTINVAGKEYELNPGSMILVPAGISHHLLIPRYGFLMIAREQNN